MFWTHLLEITGHSGKLEYSGEKGIIDSYIPYPSPAQRSSPHGILNLAISTLSFTDYLLIRAQLQGLLIRVSVPVSSLRHYPILVGVADEVLF